MILLGSDTAELQKHVGKGVYPTPGARVTLAVPAIAPWSLQKGKDKSSTFCICPSRTVDLMLPPFPRVWQPRQLKEHEGRWGVADVGQVGSSIP